MRANLGGLNLLRRPRESTLSGAVERALDLPDYQNPPIDEVALGVQFDPIAGFTDAHAGLMWGQLRDRYPRTEVHPPADIPIEDLSGPPPVPTGPSIFFGAGQQPASRTWLISDDDTELLQIQGSRVVFNWRRRGDADYPHLERIADQFVSGYTSYRETLGQVGLTPTLPSQVELSYFNWMPGDDAADVFVPAAPPIGLEPSLTREDFGSQWAFIDEREGRPVARFRVEFSPAARVPGPDESSREPERGHRLVLSYRAPMVSEAWDEEVERLAGWGRDIIVRTFTALTTEGAHKIWRRIK